MPGRTEGNGSTTAIAPSELETFVIVHDQELLLSGEAEGLYRHLANPRFVLVGTGATDRVTQRRDVVVARELEHNIEHRSNLVAFTAWFAISKNGLSTASYISLLEYDVEVAGEFSASTLEALKTSPADLIGYLPMPLTHPLYADTEAPFRSALEQAYGLDVDAMVARELDSTGQDLWTATSNLSLSREALDAFVDWYLPVADAFGSEPLGGHVHERCLWVFGVETGRPSRCLPGLLAHRQDGSHGVDVEQLPRRQPTGARRLPRRPSDPQLSIVVATRDDGAHLGSVLEALSPSHQAGVDSGEYEIIVVDNGSSPPLDRDWILSFGSNLRHFYRGASDPTPARAVDFGVEMARGDLVGLFEDCRNVASRGLLLWVRRAGALLESSVIRAPARSGPDSLPRASYPGAFFCSRRRYLELGGYGGLASFERRVWPTGNPACITLLGEATTRLVSENDAVAGDVTSPSERESSTGQIACFGHGPAALSVQAEGGHGLEALRAELADRDREVERLSAEVKELNGRVEALAERLSEATADNLRLEASLRKRPLEL